MAGYNGDAIIATTAQLNYPNYIAVDTTGNVYIQDPGNGRVRKVDIATGYISTFAGIGVRGFSADGEPATSAKVVPAAMAWDTYGNFYFADADNRRIRKIDASGILSTIAGNGISGITGDGGPATAALVNIPLGLCTDRKGNVYIQDSAQSVRKIDMGTGIITRVAGTGDNISGPYTGDGVAATNAHIGPFGISVDDTGNLYVSDYTNSIIEKVDMAGIIHTIAGTGTIGYSGDGGAALLAKIGLPENVVVDKCNNVYIADFNNKRVRKVTYHASCDPSLQTSGITGQKFAFYPNPITNELHIDNAKAGGKYRLLNIVGATMLQGRLDNVSNVVDVSGMAGGVYVLEVTDEQGGRMVHKIVKE